MRRRSSPTVADLLRSTLFEVERQVARNSNETGELHPDEQTVRQLESSVLLMLAEMQLRCSERRDRKLRIHLVSGRSGAASPGTEDYPGAPDFGERDRNPDAAHADESKAS